MSYSGGYNQGGYGGGAGGYGAPPGGAGSYSSGGGTPGAAGGYGGGGAPGGAGGYNTGGGASGYGAPPGGGQGGYGAQGGAAGGYGTPPPQGYGAPPPQGYGAPGGASIGYGGGFSQPPARGPPPGVDPQLWHWFSSVDIDRSGAITAIELERALVNGDWTPFDLDTVKLLMTLFDQDRNGTIGINEFVGLWNYIKEWQGVFKMFDRDGSGSIDFDELARALSSFGFQLTPRVIDLVIKKYDLKSTGPARVQAGGQPQTGISFDRFVRACVVIKQIHESFVKLDVQRRGVVQMGYEDFMATVLQLP